MRSRDVVLFIASAIAMVLATYTGVTGQIRNDCQVRVNEAQAVAQRERAAAADQDRAADRTEAAAIRELVRAVFASKTQTEVLAANARYELAVAEVDRQRADAEEQRRLHPLPPLPSETCGGTRTIGQ